MIQAEVIARFEQLKDMATVARATADGLRPEVLHWQEESQKQASAFEFVSRDFGRVDIRDGQPFRSVTREKRVGNLVTWHVVHEHVPELASYVTELSRVRE